MKFEFKTLEKISLCSEVNEEEWMDKSIHVCEALDFMRTTEQYLRMLSLFVNEL